MNKENKKFQLWLQIFFLSLMGLHLSNFAAIEWFEKQLDVTLFNAPIAYYIPVSCAIFSLCLGAYSLFKLSEIAKRGVEYATK
jgi:hypothetical protein